MFISKNQLKALRNFSYLIVFRKSLALELNFAFSFMYFFFYFIKFFFSFLKLKLHICEHTKMSRSGNNACGEETLVQFMIRQNFLFTKKFVFCNRHAIVTV